MRGRDLTWLIAVGMFAAIWLAAIVALFGLTTRN